jgi:hypothetical protein
MVLVDHTLLVEASQKTVLILEVALLKVHTILVGELPIVVLHSVEGILILTKHLVEAAQAGKVQMRKVAAVAKIWL